MARGALWMVFGKVVDRSLGLVSTLVLARLLVPGDFGLIAMASSLTALLELLGAFGVDLNLIRRQDAGATSGSPSLARATCRIGCRTP